MRIIVTHLFDAHEIATNSRSTYFETKCDTVKITHSLVSKNYDYHGKQINHLKGKLQLREINLFPMKLSKNMAVLNFRTGLHGKSVDP